MSDRVRAGLGASVRALFIFGGIAPFLPALVEGLPGLDAVGRLLDAWFSFQCHRDEARALVTSAVCARCLGIYVGLALGALVVRPRLPPFKHLAWLAVSAAVLVADVLTEALGWRPAWAPLRLVTGFSLAYPVGVSIAGALQSGRRVSHGEPTRIESDAG
jgi:uncharacterized membrane protein